MYKRQSQTGNVRELYIREHYVIREIRARKFRLAKISKYTVYICQDGGAVGFVDFTKLSFALSSLAQPFDQMGSIPEHVFVILS